MSKTPHVSISDLLDAGVHFGHKTSRWNPKMAPYLYGIKDDVHIIDLQQTLPLLNVSLKAIYDIIRKNGRVLFVGTKIQAGEVIAEYAQECGQYYVNHRWLGGMLTNWGTVSKSIKTLENLEKILDDEETASGYTKKELLDISRKKEKLERSLGGIRSMGGKPDLLIVIDTNKEKIAIQEARTLNIPIIAVVDSNSDPDNIDYPIPGNDDAIRSIKLYCSLFAQSALAGIEDALSASGVDLGAVAGGEGKFKAGKKVAKLQNSKKVSRSFEGAQSSDEEIDYDTGAEEVEEEVTKDAESKKPSAAAEPAVKANKTSNRK
jgi:small subunit ribosomal protein S2